MRRFLTLTLNFFAICSFATQQQIDTVYYKGMESSLYPWPLPTPLELIFKYKEPEKRPFDWCSTGNYRGHIAVWEISEDKLYLNRVYASCEERQYTMNEIFGDTVLNEPIVASWFSGFLEIDSYPKKRAGI